MAQPATRPQCGVMSETTRPFLKALGLSALVIAAIVVFAVTRGVDPEAAGELAGRLAVAPLLAGIVVGFWARNARGRWGWLDFAWRFVLCSVGFFGLNAVGQTQLRGSHEVEMTQAELEHLEVRGAEARHSDFGIVVPLPGDGYGIAAELERDVNKATASHRGMHSWPLHNPERDGIIIVIVAKGLGDETAFRGFAEGMRRSARTPSSPVLYDSLTWNSARREFRFGVMLTGPGVYVRTRCVPSRGRRSFIACAQLVTAGPEELESVLDGFRLERL